MFGMSLEITEEVIAGFVPEARALIDALRAQNAELAAQVARLEAEAAQLRAEVAVLTEKLGCSPQNSSLPPSSAHPHAKPPPNKPRAKSKTKRKRGGQKGHRKHQRELIPSDQCAEVLPLRPDRCRRCSAALTGEDADPLRHQVWDLPVIEPIVTEYQLHRLQCPCCQTSTCAALPEGVPAGRSGPNLIAFVAVLMAHFRQSKRRTAMFLETLLGTPCSTGLTVKLQTIATEALQPNYRELKDALPSEPVVGGDESPSKQAEHKAWVWTFVAGAFTVFAVRTTRAASVLKEFLGQFRGVVNCDRAKMYWALGQPQEECSHTLQWCWAHLKRDFQKLIDSPDHQAKRLGHDLMRQAKELFRQWSRCRDGTITHQDMKDALDPVRQQVESLLLRGAMSGNRRLEGMCNELSNHREWLWTFLEQEGIEPTNNKSERALRHAVIWRKLSFGTQSASGSRFVETMLTVIETCRQQKRNVHRHVTAAVQAHLSGRPTPSLLPDL